MPADTRTVIILILLNSWRLIEQLYPWVLGGIFLGALVSTLIPRDRTFGFVKGRGTFAVLPAASAIGMVSPACTYGTVPIFVEAIKRGASVGPAAAFLVASSLVNPQMSVLAAGALGWKMAALQIAVALIAALIVGAAAEIAVRKGISLESRELTAARMAEEEPAQADRMMKGKHRGHHHHRPRSEKPESFLHRFVRKFIDLFEFIGFYFLIGTLIAETLPFIVSPGLLMSLLGQGKWYAVPLGAVASVPTYMCGGGMIPFLADAAKGGMHHGAIIAFLIAGPATRITPLAALTVILKKRYVALYALFIMLLAMAVGFLFAALV